MPLQPDSTPEWFSRLPEFAPRPGHRVVIVDNQVLSYYLIDGKRDDPGSVFLMEDPRIIVQIGRQVINETLHSVGVADKWDEPDGRGGTRRVVVPGPGLPPALHRRMWEQMTALVARDKLVLAGIAQMTAEQRIRYDVLAPLIANLSGGGMGELDARVAADALVRRIPIYSLDRAFRKAYRAALPKIQLAECLRDYKLTEFAAHLFVGAQD
jgi:hypothetical protein